MVPTSLFTIFLTLYAGKPESKIKKAVKLDGTDSVGKIGGARKDDKTCQRNDNGEDEEYSSESDEDSGEDEIFPSVESGL